MHWFAQRNVPKETNTKVKQKRATTQIQIQEVVKQTNKKSKGNAKEIFFTFSFISEICLTFQHEELEIHINEVNLTLEPI